MSSDLKAGSPTTHTRTLTSHKNHFTRQQIYSHLLRFDSPTCLSYLLIHLTMEEGRPRLP